MLDAAATSSTMTSGHYFDRDPDTPSRERDVDLVLPDLSLRFRTDAGVFSADRIDPGTKLLLLEGGVASPDHGPLLDLGCGYGPIAVTLARRCPEATVWAVDVNERARELCRANALASGVGERVRVAAPDEVPDELVFGQIWSNPPIRIGKAAMHQMLRHWLARLDPLGSAHLVVNRHLGADSLGRWLIEQGFEVERRRSRMGYRLLELRASPRSP